MRRSTSSCRRSRRVPPRRRSFETPPPARGPWSSIHRAASCATTPWHKRSTRPTPTAWDRSWCVPTPPHPGSTSRCSNWAGSRSPSTTSRPWGRRILARAPTRSPTRSAGHRTRRPRFRAPRRSRTSRSTSPPRSPNRRTRSTSCGRATTSPVPRSRWGTTRQHPTRVRCPRSDRPGSPSVWRPAPTARSTWNSSSTARSPVRCKARPGRATCPSTSTSQPSRSTPTDATAPEPTSALSAWWSPRGSPAASAPTTSWCPGRPGCTASSRRTTTTSPASVPTATPVRATSSCRPGSGCTRSRTPNRARSTRMCCRSSAARSTSTW